jgi:hypothetical protein
VAIGVLSVVTLSVVTDSLVRALDRAALLVARGDRIALVNEARVVFADEPPGAGRLVDSTSTEELAARS